VFLVHTKISFKFNKRLLSVIHNQYMNKLEINW